MVGTSTALLVLGFFAYQGFGLWWDTHGTVGSLIATSDTKGSTEATDAAKDTDGDGLHDWEETLWKSDPNKTDSDGDGTSDGDEVKANRDPAKKGPNDNISFTPPPIKQELIDKDDTLTSGIGKYLALQLVSKKMKNGKITEADAEEISQALYSQIENTSLGGASTVTLDQIKTVPTNQQNLRLFAIQTSRIINKVFKGISGLGNPLIRAQGMTPEAVYDATTPHVKIFEDAKKDLLAQAVPMPYADVYLEMLNQIERGRQSFIAIRNMPKDPTLALVGINQYATVNSGLIASMQKAQEQLAKDGVIFSPQEIQALFNGTL
jgi:hypothetical protein